MQELYWRVQASWEARIAARWRRMRFVLSCKLHKVELMIGDDVRFYHAVRLYGLYGKINIENGVWFAFNGGAKCLSPIVIEMRGKDAELHIRENVVMMRSVRIICYRKVVIGRGTTIGDGCLLLDSDVHNYAPGAWMKPVAGTPVVLGDSVHLAPDVTVLKGVTVGDNTTVGSRSVVIRSLPANCVALGNPARVFLRYETERPVAVR
jgi:acetyltransferase-like isoleucine patch superfamily enzyme